MPRVSRRIRHTTNGITKEGSSEAIHAPPRRSTRSTAPRAAGRMLPHHGGEAARRPTGRLDAHDLVGEREQQLTSLRVREQPAEPVLPPTLGASGVGQAVGEHPPRERDGLLDPCRVGGHVPIEARGPTVTSLSDDAALHERVDRRVGRHVVDADGQEFVARLLRRRCPARTPCTRRHRCT